MRSALVSLLLVIGTFVAVGSINLVFPYGVGQPPQGCWVFYDLNSARTLFFNRIQKDGSRRREAFDPNASTTFRSIDGVLAEPFHAPAHAEDGLLKGGFGHDFIDEVNTNVTFGLVDEVVGGDPTKAYFGGRTHGIIGLGREANDDFSRQARLSGSTLCIANDCRKNNANPVCYGSIFRLDKGGPDVFERYNGSVYYTDVRTRPQYRAGWSFDVDGFSFGPLKSRRPFVLTIASTNEFLVVPDFVHQTILKTLNATWNETLKAHVADKNAMNAAPLVFNINGVEVPVAAQNFLDIPYRFDRNIAIVKVIGGAKANQWIAGDPFIEAVAFCLDYERDLISFYKVVLSPDPLTTNDTKTYRWKGVDVFTSTTYKPN